MGGSHVRKSKFAFALLLALSAPAFAADMPGVTATEIKIGGVFPFSGPASSIGLVGQGRSLPTCNRSMIRGGINGRKINYIAMDDAYSRRSRSSTSARLVDGDEVSFIFSQLGTARATPRRRKISGRERRPQHRDRLRVRASSPTSRIIR
jgi:hypothetical protein